MLGRASSASPSAASGRSRRPSSPGWCRRRPAQGHRHAARRHRLCRRHRRAARELPWWPDRLARCVFHRRAHWPRRTLSATGRPAPDAARTERLGVGGWSGLCRAPDVAIGMAATALAFMGQFTLSTYLRPLPEGVTGPRRQPPVASPARPRSCPVRVGTAMVGFLLRSHLRAVLVGLPALMAVLSLLLIVFGHSARHRGVAGCAGAFSQPDPRGMGHMDDAGHPGRPRSGRRPAGRPRSSSPSPSAPRSAGCCSTRHGWWSPFAPCRRRC